MTSISPLTDPDVCLSPPRCYSPWRWLPQASRSGREADRHSSLPSHAFLGPSGFYVRPHMSPSSLFLFSLQLSSLSSHSIDFTESFGCFYLCCHSKAKRNNLCGKDLLILVTESSVVLRGLLLRLMDAIIVCSVEELMR